MSTELTVAIIAGAFSIIAASLSVLATIIANSLRREMQIRIIEPRLKVYKQLWAMMDVVSPSISSEYSQDERRDFKMKFTAWYYENGNGMFLSAKSRRWFVKAKDSLLNPTISSQDIRKMFSNLRSEMKNDIGVYGKEEVNASSKDINI